MIDILLGKRTEKVLQHGHESLSTFGIGTELDASQWRSVLRQLVTQRLIYIDHDRFNVLRLGEASREVLKGERQLMLRRQLAQPTSKRKERRPVDAVRVTAIGDENTEVFEALRTWRKEVARDHGVPAYTVFHDSTLHAVAAVLPRSLEQLKGISGIGATKLERYGRDLIDVVQRVARG